MICTFLILLSVFVLAQNKIKIDIPESVSSNSLPLTVSLFDAQNNLIEGSIKVTVKDAEESSVIEKIIESNKLTEIDLGENARAGLWEIIVEYQDMKTIESFTLETNEEVEFKIQNDNLIIKNTGNKRYSKEIDIKIGNSLGTKKVDLEIGEETSFRLVAPNGNYKIIVTDGKTTITKSNVALIGNVIGILDEKLADGGNSVTGGLRPGSELGDESFYSSIKDKKFAYVFLLVVIGAAILLAVERRYRKRV